MGLKQLEAILAQARFVFLDTNIFIYQLANHPEYGPSAGTVLRCVESGGCAGLTTTITLAELLVMPAKQERPDALLNYEAYLVNFPNLQIAVVDAAVAREAAMIRAATGAPMPDAIQLAAAAIFGVDLVITNDKRWRERANYPPVVQLARFLESGVPDANE